MGITYLIIVLIFLVTIFWILKKSGKGKLGCIIPGVIVLFTATFSLVVWLLFTSAYSATTSVLKTIYASGSSSVELSQWALCIALDLISLIIIAAFFSIVGYLLNGQQPKVCKLFWKCLLHVVIHPLIIFILLGVTALIVFVIQMKFTSTKFDDMSLWTILIIAFIAFILALCAITLAGYSLYPYNKDLNMYEPKESKYTYRRLDNNENASLDEQKGGKL